MEHQIEGTGWGACWLVVLAAGGVLVAVGLLVMDQKKAVALFRFYLGFISV